MRVDTLLSHRVTPILLEREKLADKLSSASNSSSSLIKSSTTLAKISYFTSDIYEDIASLPIDDVEPARRFSIAFLIFVEEERVERLCSTTSPGTSGMSERSKSESVKLLDGSASIKFTFFTTLISAVIGRCWTSVCTRRLSIVLIFSRHSLVTFLSLQLVIIVIEKLVTWLKLKNQNLYSSIFVSILLSSSSFFSRLFCMSTMIIFCSFRSCSNSFS